MEKTQQMYRELKAKHPELIILLRCGDFYESRNIDAKTISEILGIRLTWRNNKRNFETYDGAIASFPHYALDTYLPKLIRAGKKVAICDQFVEPKKLSKRGSQELV